MFYFLNLIRFNIELPVHVILDGLTCVSLKNEHWLTSDETCTWLTIMQHKYFTIEN